MQFQLILAEIYLRSLIDKQQIETIVLLNIGTGQKVHNKKKCENVFYPQKGLLTLKIKVKFDNHIRCNGKF